MRGSLAPLADSKYEIIRELGRGGMGVVYLAMDTRLERQVALKMLHPNLAQSDKAVAAFRREAHAVGNLYHSHIIHVNSLEILDESLCIDMPFLPGGSMRELIAKGMPYSALARVMADSLDALACCHEAGIVHCDVKPSNLLFDGSGSVKLSDFGLAKLERVAWSEAVVQSASTVILAGTPKYMCPEAWSGNDPTPLHDIYALGMLAREAVSGDIPYQGETPYAFQRSVMETPLTPLRDVSSDVSEPFSSLIDSMTEKAPENRPPTAQLALAALRECPEYADTGSTNEVTVTVPRWSSGSSSSFRAGRKKKFFGRRLALVVGLLAVFAALVWLLPNVQDVLPRREQRTDVTAAHASRSESVQLLVGTRPDGEPWHMLLRRNVENGRLEGLARSPRSIWTATLTEDDEGAFHVTGTWAEFGNRQGIGFDWGTLSGKARLETGVVGPAWYSLRFESAAHPRMWEEALVSRPLATPMTGSAFIAEFESSAIALPLLYNELAQRDPAHLRIFSKFLPAHTQTRLEGREITEVESPEIDGAAEDKIWADLNGQALEGTSLEHPSRMIACYDMRGLYLLFEVEELQTSNWELILQAIGTYQVPFQKSTRFTFRLNEEGVEGAELRDGNERKLTNPALAAWDWSGNTLTAELFIPWRTLRIASTRPASHYLRLGAALNETVNGNSVPITHWGAEGSAAAPPQIALQVPVLKEGEEK